MKQVLHNFRTGRLSVYDVPRPALSEEALLVANEYSLISAGTERTLRDFAQKGLLGKARERPDLVRKAIQKARQEGLVSVFHRSMARLDQLAPLGYSSAGTVVKVGGGITDFSPGDRVACAGAGYACHAEIVNVPRNLCVPVPQEVTLQDASFVTLGAIAMHGVRNAQCALGDEVAVIGLGLVGLLVVQICKAAGCAVLGIDGDRQRVQLAQDLGADVAKVRGEGDVKAAFELPHGHGVDSVIITAATSSNDPVTLAADIARDRARVSVVGLVGMDIPRKTYYEKELELVVSRSYGPGRYDPNFEEKGLHYPVGYVHWVESRNMQHFLQLIASGKVRTAELISEIIDIEQAEQAYELITQQAEARPLAVLLKYPEAASAAQDVRIDISEPDRSKPAATDQLGVGLIGAGQFSRGVLLPALRGVGNCRLRAIATATGASAIHAGERFGADYCTTEYEQLLEDEQVEAVFIATRHNLHAQLAIEALRAGKAVFVEKPLALDMAELQSVLEAAQSSRGLMVGFNRRFSPHTRRAQEFMASVEGSLVMDYRVNAGALEPDSWVLDPEIGGGRVVGEVCHFVDMLRFFADSSIEDACAWHTPNSTDPSTQALLRFANGSIGTITYVTSGAEAAGKERLEIHGGGATVILDDYSRTMQFRGGRRQVYRPRGQDKGHQQELREFVNAVLAGGPMPIPLQQIAEVHEATFAISRPAQPGN